MQKIQITPAWFEEWFNSPYYHLLYQNRNEIEAEKFISRLFGYINLPKQADILDAACGKGRHARYMASYGYNVLGIDLSPENINFAKKYLQPNLNFAIHNLIDPIPNHLSFNLITNLFTSFGYADTELDDIKILNNLSNALKPQGIFVLDYLNQEYVQEFASANKHEIKVINNIVFDISREIDSVQNLVTKKIKITDDNKNYNFYEKVRLYSEEFLTQTFNNLGAKSLEIHNSYLLNGKTNHPGDRCIFIAKF